MELLSPEGLRLDGRRPRELRRLDVEIGTLGKADGSATFTMGNTIVTAAVFGPHEVTLGRQAQQQDRAVVNCEARCVTRRHPLWCISSASFRQCGTVFSRGTPCAGPR